MMAFINRAFESILDLFAFARAVAHDARMQKREIEEQYGPLGF